MKNGYFRAIVCGVIEESSENIKVALKYWFKGKYLCEIVEFDPKNVLKRAEGREESYLGLDDRLFVDYYPSGERSERKLVKSEDQEDHF